MGTGYCRVLSFKGFIMGLKRRAQWVFATIIISVGLISLASHTEGKGAGYGNSRVKGSIIFSSVASGNWDIWSVNPDGSELRQITDTKINEHSPAVSPDGREIVYVDTERSLWIINIDGSSRQEIPLPKSIYAQPAWAPDGNKIAFVKFMVIPSDSSEIWSIERKNGEWGEPERLSAHPPMRVYP